MNNVYRNFGGMNRMETPQAETPRTSYETQYSGSNQSPEQAQHGGHSYPLASYSGVSNSQGYASLPTVAPTYQNYTTNTGYGSAYALPTAATSNTHGQSATSASNNQQSYAAASNNLTPQTNSNQAHGQLQGSQSASSQLAQLSTISTRLHDSFKVIKPRTIDKFFFPGRVFSTLWIEPASPTAPATASGLFTLYKYSENAFAEIRRFIVMNSNTHRSLCIPISSYRGYGVLNRHDAQFHSVAHTSEVAPAIFQGENINRNPIRIKLSESTTAEDELSSASRVNFSDTYTVQHNVKVKKIGQLGSEDLKWARRYWHECIREE